MVAFSLATQVLQCHRGSRCWKRLFHKVQGKRRHPAEGWRWKENEGNRDVTCIIFAGERKACNFSPNDLQGYPLLFQADFVWLLLEGKEEPGPLLLAGTNCICTGLPAKDLGSVSIFIRTKLPQVHPRVERCSSRSANWSTVMKERRRQDELPLLLQWSGRMERGMEREREREREEEE